MAGVPSNVGHIPVAGVPSNVGHILWQVFLVMLDISLWLVFLVMLDISLWLVFLEMFSGYTHEEDTCTWVHILSRVHTRAVMTWLKFMSCHTSRMHYIVV